MFKNILKFLFEEEEEDLVEEPLEEINLASPVFEKKEEKKPMKQKPAVKPVKEEPIKHSVNQAQPIKKERERLETDSKPKKRFIDFDEPQRTVHHDSQGSSRMDTKRDYEFSPVISPIFGTKEDIMEREAMDQESTVVRVKKKNPLGTIISPMYGATELEEMEDQAKEKLAKTAAQKSQDMDSVEEFMKEEPAHKDILNMPLEDLLAEDDDNELDDVMQFSLFGGEEAVKASDEEPVFAIDEEA